MPDPIPVAVVGAQGRVGREVIAGLEADHGFACVAAVDRDQSVERALADSGARLLVDFTAPQAGLRHALLAVEAGVAPVVGTTGLGEGATERIRDAAERRGIGGCVAGNFALGAVLLEWLAALAAPYVESAEIVEAHGPHKLDAPSGTALRTAAAMLAARDGRPFAHRAPEHETLVGTRGGSLGGIAVHSLRVDGVVAEQEVILGSSGETLRLGQRTTSRAAYVPGVLLACREVDRTHRFYDGLAEVVGLPAVAAVQGLSA